MRYDVAPEPALPENNYAAAGLQDQWPRSVPSPIEQPPTQSGVDDRWALRGTDGDLGYPTLPAPAAGRPSTHQSRKMSLGFTTSPRYHSGPSPTGEALDMRAPTPQPPVPRISRFSRGEAAVGHLRREDLHLLSVAFF
jgi:hypothetical protein